MPHHLLILVISKKKGYIVAAKNTAATISFRGVISQQAAGVPVNAVLEKYFFLIVQIYAKLNPNDTKPISLIADSSIPPSIFTQANLQDFQ